MKRISVFALVMTFGVVFVGTAQATNWGLHVCPPTSRFFVTDGKDVMFFRVANHARQGVIFYPDELRANIRWGILDQNDPTVPANAFWEVGDVALVTLIPQNWVARVKTDRAWVADARRDRYNREMSRMYTLRQQLEISAQREGNRLVDKTIRELARKAFRDIRWDIWH